MYVNSTTKTGRWFGRELSVFTYKDSKVRITSISFKIKLDYPKCFLHCIAGGINSNNVSVQVKSVFNKGFCVHMEIFGQPITKGKSINRIIRDRIKRMKKTYMLIKYKRHKRLYKNYKVIL